MRFQAALGFLFFFLLQYSWVKCTNPGQGLNPGASVGGQFPQIRNTPQSSSITSSLPAGPVASSSSGLPSAASPPKQKLSREDRQKLKQAQQKLAQDLISGPTSRFEGKHLFKNGEKLVITGRSGNSQYKHVQNSFDFLSADSSKAKNYLIDLNLKLYKGGVLPQASKNQFDSWFASSDKKFVTIVDADIDDLTKSIKGQFDHWAIGKPRDANGKFLDPIPNFTTGKKHTVTHITFQAKKDSSGNFVDVEVKAQQYSTKVSMGTDIDGSGKISHLETISPKGAALQEKTLASFTRAELDDVATRTQKFWKDLGVPASAHSVILNEGLQEYKTMKQDFDDQLKQNPPGTAPAVGSSSVASTSGACPTTPGGRRKRAAVGAGNCAFFVKPNGDVDSVHPKGVIDEYKKADSEGKKKLAAMAKDNMNKVQDVDGVNSDNKKKIAKLVQVEDVKTHVDMVNSISKLESTTKGKSSRMSSMLDTVKAKFSNAKTKLSNSKVARGLASVANSKFGKSFSTGVGTVSGSLGTFFLAKTVVNGIIKGDTTSLAIVGARVGYEVATQSAVWAGAKFFKATTKIGKAAKYLGKVAGPIGAVADIGLSVWSLTKSVQRLTNATNQYDKNDAIADIVSDSIDIAVTATVTVLSIAFPPAAPIIIAVGAIIDLLAKLATALFKAGNEVAKINAEIPLLDFEKREVYTSRFFDWFGTRQKDYIDFLLEEKAANDMAVQHNLKFLQDNPSFLGMVFPSRTLAYDGGCHLTKRHCALKNAWGCTRWENLKTMASGCDWNRPCSDSWGTCIDHWERVGGWGYDDFKCVCNQKSTTSFGFPRQDSLVDFREKQSVYWERAVPKDVENAEFICKPGSTSDHGYKISQSHSKSEYLCENAIGLMQPSHKRKTGQVMLFDLEDGHDRVYLSGTSPTPNLFRMGNEGRKEFYGGGGRNEFLLDGDCTKSLKGTLSGGRSDSDAITILDTCSKGKEIQVNFASGKLQTSGGNVDISFSNVEDVYGRRGESDKVVASCSTRKVILGGGNSGQEDFIDIPNPACPMNLTVLTSGHTKVNSKATLGDITVLVESPWNLIDIKGDIHSKNGLSFNVIFMDTASQQILLEQFSVNGKQLEATFGKSGKSERAKFNLNFVSSSNQDVPVYFTESPKGSPYSVLMLSLQNSPVFYHSLPKTQSHTRKGSVSIPNVFEVIGQSWTAIGGDKSDEFILHTPHVTLDGGKGEDTLRLHKEFKTSVPLDLGGGRLKNIENVYGIAGNPITIKTACDTKLVVPFGGSSTHSDVVIVPHGRCSKRELQIIAKGHTRVVIEGEVGSTTSDIVSVVTSSESLLQFELETKSKTTSGLVNLIQVTHKNWKIAKISRNNNPPSLQFHLIGSKDNGEFLKFILHVSRKQENAAYLDIPHIQFSQKDSNEPSGMLVIEAETHTPKILYTLNKSTEAVKVVGFQGIQNMFGITAPGPWKLTGGNENDVFSASILTGISINGGVGGENALVLINHSSTAGKAMVINLEKGEMGLLHSTQKGTVANIHDLIGRQSQPDVFHANCSTNSLKGGGGSGKGSEDIIFISETICRNGDIPKMTLEVGSHTKVKNSAKKGQFTYYVENLLTADIQVAATKDNLHFIKFASDPWTLIENTAFNQKGSTLGLKLKSGRVQEFPMFRKLNSAEYTNPVFEFHRPGSSISSDIRIEANGAITSTFIIQGRGPSISEVVSGIPVDLNRFLINITDHHSQSSSGVIKGSGKSGGNQFWVFSLNHMTTLDGGNCMEAVGCTNYLQFGEGFQTGKPIEVDLDQETGSVKVSGKVMIQNVKNMQEVQGRRNDSVLDKVYVTCATRSVSDFEEINIRAAPGVKQCFYNLILGIGKHTRVLFEEPKSENYTSTFNDTFHYRFTTPRSFRLEGSEFMMLGGNHNFYLPFKLDDLEGMRFDEEHERLFYSISGKDYHLAMITGHMIPEQFYLQPVMVTQEGFLLQVGLDGSILLSIGSSSSYSSLENIQNQVIPTFETTAQRLGVTIILQTSKEFLYVGHGNMTGDRNVVQNLGSLTSHLVGGGAEDTIYDITSLDNDVFIYSGFEELKDLEDFTSSNVPKQTIDVTDIIVQIRFESGTKYVPKLARNESHLIISMEGYEAQYPGKIILYHGALEKVASRVQLLFSNVIMDLLPADNGNTSEARLTRSVGEPEEEDNFPQEWKFQPRPIEIPKGYIYSISPEDLEDNQEIHIAENYNISKSPSKFKMVRNGSDLYLTNMLEMGAVKENQEVTTIVISDFYKASVAPPENSLSDSIGANDTETNEQLPQQLPGTMSGITVSLPGLNLILNDSEVITFQHFPASENSPETTTVTVLSKEDITEWKYLLYDVEERLLYDMPDIPRMFVCDGCVDSSYLHFAVIIGLPWGVLLISTCACLYYSLKQRKKATYSVANANKSETRKLLGEN